ERHSLPAPSAQPRSHHALHGLSVLRSSRRYAPRSSRIFAAIFFDSAGASSATLSSTPGASSIRRNPRAEGAGGERGSSEADGFGALARGSSEADGFGALARGSSEPSAIRSMSDKDRPSSSAETASSGKNAACSLRIAFSR